MISADSGKIIAIRESPNLKGTKVTLQDLMSETIYEREGDDLLTRGLYLALPACGFHVFDCQGQF